MGGEEGIRGVLEFFVATGVLIPLLVGVVAALAITWLLRRQGLTHAPGWLLYSAVLSVVAILVMTLFREFVPLIRQVAVGGVPDWPGWRGLLEWSPDGWWRATSDPLRSMQIVLNAVLFVPAGYLWTVVTLRPIVTLLGLGLASVGIELVQAVTGLGASDAADILANVAGAAVGVGAGVATLWTRAEMAADHAGGRRWLLRATSLAGGAAVVAAAMVGGASYRQGALADEANAAFEGTTLGDVQRWERAEELPDRVWFGALSRDVDAFGNGPDSVTARYPASFLTVRRCVFVAWDQDGVTVEQRAGSVCDAATIP